MQVMKMDMGLADCLHPARAGQNKQAASTTEKKTGQNKKFAEIYAQLSSVGGGEVENKIQGRGPSPGNDKGSGKGTGSAETRLFLVTDPRQAQQIRAGKNDGSAMEGQMIPLNRPLMNKEHDAGRAVPMMAGARGRELPGDRSITSYERHQKLVAGEAINKIAHDKPMAASVATVKYGEKRPVTWNSCDTRMTADAAAQLTGQVFKMAGAGENRSSRRVVDETSNNTFKIDAGKADGDAGKPIKKAHYKQINGADNSGTAETKTGSDAEAMIFKMSEKSQRREEKTRSTESGRNAGSGVSQLQSGVSAGQLWGKTTVEAALKSNSPLEFITASLMGQIKNGISSLEVDLKPEYLGRIKLLLEMKDGQVSVRIIAHNAEALALMNSTIPAIQENLEQQGVSINHMSVDIGSYEKQGEPDGNGYREENSPDDYPGEQQEYGENTGGWESNYVQSGILNILA